MATLAGFIGIDRYKDPQIRDLTGAGRDATALWALLSDSIPALASTRLLDGEATLDAVRDLFARTLDAATADDVVILSFAGHGTRDHRLVLADTVYADIPSTSITMEELATRFAASRARAIFCILDCCFSGGASARVLEASAGLRDVGIPLQQVAGRGRVLLAASNVDEPALEDPISRHGLFTKALLACLQEAAAPVSIVGIIDNVVAQVRAAAARMGRVQTPVLFGHVEGSVTFPAMKRGAKFASAFPEYGRASVTADFQDLADFGIGQPVLDIWRQCFPAGLNALQLSAINDHGVLSRRSLLTVAPTSAGKTMIGEIAAIKAISLGEKAVFLLPYKALVNEKYDEFAELYGARLGLRIARCSGDWQDQIGTILRGKFDIAFFTYETFLNLSVTNPHVLSQLGLLVLDEAQFITDQRRGIVVELLLTNLVSSRNRGVAPQIITLSAVIGHTNSFERWLGCDALIAVERPVPLLEGVMDRSGSFQARASTGDVTTSQLLPRDVIQVRRDKPGSQDMLVPLVRHLIGQGEKVIVFRNNRGSAGGCAEYLANELGLPPVQAAIDLLPQHDQSTTSQQLAKCLAGGTALHTSNLSREERSIVETSFRDSLSPLRVLVATSTVAAGVNTPASTVIVVETDLYDGERRNPYTVAQYKNMAGRAGRLGFETQGKAIILAETGIQRGQLFRRYIEGVPEAITSSFDPQVPDTWIVRLLAQVERVTRPQAIELVANTYGGFLANLARPGWLARFQTQMDALLRRMEADGLIEAIGDDQIQLSMLGHACGQSPFSLHSAMQLVETLRHVGSDYSAPGLMALVQGLPELDDDYTPVGRGRIDASRPAELAARFGSNIANALSRRAGKTEVYYARCKRALILNDWLAGISVEEIERRYSPNAFVRVGHGDIRGFADATRFFLASASRIAAIVHAGAGPNEEEIDLLLKRLDLGLPVEALSLTTIQISLTRGEYLTLFQAGYRDREQVATLTRKQLTALIGERRAHQLAARLQLAEEPLVA